MVIYTKLDLLKLLLDSWRRIGTIGYFNNWWW
jgi:hypothetical protein